MKTPIGLVVASVLGVAGQSVAAQAIQVTCKAEVRSEPTACIMTPRDGGTVTGPAVRVVLAAKGIPIAPVESAKDGAAHYHLFLDVDVPAGSAAIPQGPGITHLGDGKKHCQLDNVAPGMHRLIVVLGDNSHVPVARQKADTAYFTVALR